MKMKMPPEMWQNQVQQQVDMLHSASEVSYLGTHDVNGVDCHAVRIVPGRASAQQMLEQTRGQIVGLGVYEPVSMDMTDVPAEVSVTQHVAVDTYLFMRTDQHMVQEIAPEAVGLPATGFERIAQDVSITIVFRNYDKPVTIQVPQGLLAAIEIN